MSGKSGKYIVTIAILAFFGQMIFTTHARQAGYVGRFVQDTLPGGLETTGDFFSPDIIINDSLVEDEPIPATDLLAADSVASDTAKREAKPFLDDIITGQNRDSLVYDVKNKVVYIYREGDVSYQNMNLKADYMQITMDTKQIYAYGILDSLGVQTRPEFLEGSTLYSMDTITYNIDSKKAKIKEVASQQGEGFLVGGIIKKMPDNTVNIAHGSYSTCDHLEHQHYRILLNKAKLIPGKKVITQFAYFEIEDVPLYPLMLPFGFFPINSSRHSGFIMPSYGEEYVKGFFLREGGYYFAFNDYIDMTVLGGFYTLGSWEASIRSRYLKRYKFSGAFDIRFSNDVIGDKGDADYLNMNNLSVTWTHSQDPKARPNSTFSASVNFSTSNYSKYGSNNMNDYLNTQTNSSVAYSKSWPGKPFSFSTNLQHSQNSRDTTVSLSFPNVVFSVSRIFPFKRRKALGKQKWYEKISMQYTGTLGNNVTVKEKDLFKDKMFKEMKNGVQHVIPISTNLTLFNYITVSPNANYTERWYFRKIEKEWSEADRAVVNSDTTYGFYRLYNYNVSASVSTTIYGMYQFGPKSPVQAIRHTITPSISATYTPDFGADKYGYYKPVQTDSTGTIGSYSPYEGGLYGVPGRGKSASLSFSLSNTLEMKVRSEADTTGYRKIKIIDNLSASSSYNFLADSMNLAPFALSLRIANIYKNLGLNINATLDPYQISESGQRINRFMLSKGKLGRITSAGTSFGYTFNSSKKNRPVNNDINSGGSFMDASSNDFFNNPEAYDMDPMLRRQIMTSQYYDFDIPWNFGFNYSLTYSKPGHRATVTQTLGFQGSVNLTPKWGLTFNGGYDFEQKKVTPGTFSLNRDLHCWQMNFTWVPIGFRKSWSFNIQVKSSMLKDLKYDRRSSYYDNLYDN